MAPPFKLRDRESDVLRIGLLGCGVVGSAVARSLLADADAHAAAAGRKLELARVAVLDTLKPRSVDLPEGSITGDAAEVCLDPDIDIVVELIGGIEPSRRLVTSALRCGKGVVTANKELIACHGSQLAATALSYESGLRFEASVGGAVPIVRVVREHLAGQGLKRLSGVLNGTTNFILARAKEGATFEDAVEEAQRLGYAESDPSADLDGRDAAAKIAILTSLAWGRWVRAEDVDRRGIEELVPDDVRVADRFGYAIKLVATATQREEGVALSVRPSLVDHDHPFAHLAGPTNGVELDVVATGKLYLSGRGAGGGPTAGGVIADLISLARGGDNGPLPLEQTYTGVVEAGCCATSHLLRVRTGGGFAEDRCVSELSGRGYWVRGCAIERVGDHWYVIVDEASPDLRGLERIFEDEDATLELALPLLER